MNPDFGVLAQRQAFCDTCGLKGWRYGASPTAWRHDWHRSGDFGVHPFIPEGTHPWVAVAVVTWRRLEAAEHRDWVAGVKAEARTYYPDRFVRDGVLTHEEPNHRDLEAS